MKIAVLGIDLGKNVCSVVGLDPSGAVVLRRRARRDTLIDPVAKLPSCIVGMRHVCGAHHLGRLFAAQGHDIRLMSSEYVRPYVKAQKNDDRGAEGIAEAATRPTMRFVEMKTEDELDMQTLHRSRERQLAWLGLVPRQSTTGGKPRLMGISERGNKYLRKLLIHGARAALPYVAGKDTALGRWAKSLLSRVHQNVAVVAFANKLARICGA